MTDTDVSESVFADVAAYLQDQVLQNPDVELLLGNLAEYAAARLGGTGPGLLCCITLSRSKKTDATVGSESRARLLGQLERKYGRGPCTTAAESGAVMVSDLRREERWPDYARAARRQGTLSVLSLPLLLEADSSGVLTLYSDHPDAFGSAGTATAQAFVEQASKGLVLALRMAKLQDARDGLTAAMQTRTVIDLATGAIMAQKRCGQATAFTVLREASNTRNIKLHDVAAAVVSSLAVDTETVTYFDE